MRFSRWRYYLTSIPTLLLNIQERAWVLRAFLGLGAPAPFLIHLKNGYRFRVRSRMDVWVIKETCLDRDYERYGVPLQNGWNVLDIGAGLGDFTVHAAKRCPQGRIYAFEPTPQSFGLLQENILLNGVTNVQAFRAAVASKGGRLTLIEEHGIPVMYRAEATQKAGQQVRAMTLADIFDTARVDVCDFLKLDVEGGEYDILLNAPPEILRRIRNISLEYHDHTTPHTHADLVNHLQQNGFRVRVYPNPAHNYIGFLSATRSS